MELKDPELKEASGSGAVSVTDWNACYNSGDDMIALSCTVTTEDSRATITGVGLILNNSKGVILCSSYTDFTSGTKSAEPALNLPPNGLVVGDTVSGVVSGEADGEHYFFEQQLTITSCS
jgi:hypothetical protein